MADKENQAITTRQFVNMEDFNKMKEMAEYFVQSNALPKGISNGPQLVMVLQAGRDLGLNVTQSMGGLTMINGVMTIYGQVAAMMMKRAGYDWDDFPIEPIKDEKGTTIDYSKKLTIWNEENPDRKKDIIYKYSEAKKSGATTKDVWDKYIEDMMYWKCLARARKRFCPDVLDGVPMFEDYKELMQSSKNEEIDGEEKTLADKIRESKNEEELKLLFDDVKKSRDANMVRLYAQQMALFTKDVIDGESTTNISEQVEDVQNVSEENGLPVHSETTNAGDGLVGEGEGDGRGDNSEDGEQGDAGESVIQEDGTEPSGE